MFESLTNNIIAIVVIALLLGISIIKKVGKLIIYILAGLFIVMIILPVLGISLF